MILRRIIMKFTKDQQGLLSIAGKQVSIKPCFPWHNKREHLSFVDENGKEIYYLENLTSLDTDSKNVLEEFLQDIEGVISIEKIYSINEEVELRKFVVRTNLGKRIFYTKLDEWPFLNGKKEIIIQDLNADIFQIKRFGDLDQQGQKLLSPLVG